jgi:hypothetical protein
MSGKKILAIGFILVLLVAIPLTVYLVQQQQKTKTGAVAATTLNLTPPSSTVLAGDKVTLAVTVNPGVNLVSFVKYTITYDTAKLATAGAGLVVTPWTATNGDTVMPLILQGPIYGDGTMSMTISVQSAPQHVMSTPTQIASVTFDTTNLTGSTTVNINKATSQVLAIGSTDQFNENVLLDTVGAIINTTTPSVTPSETPTNTPVPTEVITGEPTATPTATQQTTVIGPTCSSLTMDSSAQGTVPYTVNLTVNGQSSNSTISKVTFDFGDGQTQDIASSAGIGTNSISVLQSHIYNNPGNYTATAVLTDASGSVSPVGVCTVAINVNNGVIAAAPTETPTPIVTEAPSPLPPTGPSQLVTFGSIGAIIAVIGAILLLAL